VDKSNFPIAHISKSVFLYVCKDGRTDGQGRGGLERRRSFKVGCILFRMEKESARLRVYT
jgi:hypothetical protein